MKFLKKILFLLFMMNLDLLGSQSSLSSFKDDDSSNSSDLKTPSDKRVTPNRYSFGSIEIDFLPNSSTGLSAVVLTPAKDSASAPIVLTPTTKENVDLTQAILKTLQQLEAPQNSDVTVCWRNIFGYLRGLKPTPEKPRIKEQTIYQVTQIITQKAFELLLKLYPNQQERCKAINKFDGLAEGAKLIFATGSDPIDIDSLCTWIVSECYKYVKECGSTHKVDIKESLFGTRQINIEHILTYHSLHNVFDPFQYKGELLQKEIDTGSIVLMNSAHTLLNLVWKKVPVVGLNQKGKPASVKIDQNLRKTIFNNLSKEEISLCIERAVTTNPIADQSDWKIFKDPNTGRYIEVCYRGDGYWISTAYPMHVIEEYAWKNVAKVHVFDKCLMMPDKTVKPIVSVELTHDQLISYIRLSNTKLDAGFYYLVNIGNIDPLCSYLYDKEKMPLDNLSAQKEFCPSNQTKSYCPIYVQISKSDYDIAKNCAVATVAVGDPK